MGEDAFLEFFHLVVPALVNFLVPAALMQKLIKREHTYDIPQIIMLDIKDGSADYLRWIEEQVS